MSLAILSACRVLLTLPKLKIKEDKISISSLCDQLVIDFNTYIPIDQIKFKRKNKKELTKNRLLKFKNYE